MAESQGLQLVPPDQIPRFGTFWVVSGAQPAPPFPFLPYDLTNTPVFSLGSGGQFLVDATGDAVPQPTRRQAILGVSSSTLVQALVNVVLDLITRVQEAQANAELNAALGLSDEMSLMDAEPNGQLTVDYGTNLWIANFALSSNNAIGIVSNTLADISYEIQSKQDLLQSNWNSEGFILGSELTNWTPMSVLTSNRQNLFLRIRSWMDSYDMGIPDWWQLQYFGVVGIDPYGDPAGDGYSNLYKYQHGLNPFVFYAPQFPVASATPTVNDHGTTISWDAAQGAVVSYTIYRNGSAIATNPPSAKIFQSKSSRFMQIRTSCGMTA